LNNKQLIGISGLAGSGKDTFAKFINDKAIDDYRDVQLYAFADPLKEVCSVLFNVDIDRFYDRDHKETIITEWNKSPRTMMQLVGTDLVRRGISDAFWIDRARSALNSAHASIFIVTDVRFENEAQFIRDSGGIMYHVKRDSVQQLDHDSEQVLDFYNNDVLVYNNSSLSDLEKQVPSFE